MSDLAVTVFFYPCVKQQDRPRQLQFDYDSEFGKINLLFVKCDCISNFHVLSLSILQ
jgi:hypothetical protein